MLCFYLGQTFSDSEEILSLHSTSFKKTSSASVLPSLGGDEEPFKGNEERNYGTTEYFTKIHNNINSEY